MNVANTCMNININFIARLRAVTVVENIFQHNSIEWKQTLIK
jgi:hypothetical protein